MTTPPSRGPARRRIRVTGVVQGVGFRPFVHRLATRHRLAGWVRNGSGNVEIIVDGDDGEIDAFLGELVTDAPPLAAIAHIASDYVGLDHVTSAEATFRILESASSDGRRQPVPADAVLCDACLRELFDTTNRRFHYPFITCTDCGPRYTVIESLPYDRERTTMRRFPQCPECLREYETPGDRRYHSETNSCQTCGPSLWARLPGARLDREARLPPSEALALAGAALQRGEIVAIRGIGGFHLAVDATHDAAVSRLRLRKRREAKPFAVMVRTVGDARRIARVNDHEAALLTDRARPVVILEGNRDGGIAASVAPATGAIGVMLAYTPLHHLLLGLVDRPLVMTSGNRSEEPIAADLADAALRLDDIADLFLFHDREIVSPIDDSVLRSCAGRTSLIRRARGYAPLPIRMAPSTPTAILAVGGHLKSTFTLAAGDAAYVSPHLGDLDGLETLHHYRTTLDRYEKLFRIEPRVVARDQHDGYLSSRIAAETGLADEILVQHHHAHIAAVLGEHGFEAPVVGIAFDGTGQGDDRTIWGAEFLVADQASYTRVAHLRNVPLPGGELAVRSPWRSALGYLSLEPGLADAFRNAFAGVDARARRAAEYQIEHRLNAPTASSMGRLFDAAAAVLGLCHWARYEGEAAMRLESAAGDADAAALPFPAERNAHGMLELDPLPLLAALGRRALGGAPVEVLAAAFHESVAAATASLAEELCTWASASAVALGGGVFQNARLTGSLVSRLERRGLAVLLPVHLPANDGGLSYGQAIVAAAVLRRRASERGIL